MLGFDYFAVVVWLVLAIITAFMIDDDDDQEFERLPAYEIADD